MSIAQRPARGWKNGPTLTTSFHSGNLLTTCTANPNSRTCSPHNEDFNSAPRMTSGCTPERGPKPLIRTPEKKQTHKPPRFHSPIPPPATPPRIIHTHCPFSTLTPRALSRRSFSSLSSTRLRSPGAKYCSRRFSVTGVSSASCRSCQCISHSGPGISKIGERACMSRASSYNSETSSLKRVWPWGAVR